MWIDMISPLIDWPYSAVKYFVQLMQFSHPLTSAITQISYGSFIDQVANNKILVTANSKFVAIAKQKLSPFQEF